MYPVADDFAAIARRLREIQAEVAKEQRLADARQIDSADSDQPERRCLYDDMSACA